jgi:hypothetical protein
LVSAMTAPAMKAAAMKTGMEPAAVKAAAVEPRMETAMKGAAAEAAAMREAASEAVPHGKAVPVIRIVIAIRRRRVVTGLVGSIGL